LQAGVALLAFALLAWGIWRRRFGLRAAWFAALGGLAAPVLAPAVAADPAAVTTGVGCVLVVLVSLLRATCAGVPTWLTLAMWMAVGAVLIDAQLATAVAVVGAGPCLVLLRHRRRLAVGTVELLGWVLALCVGLGLAAALWTAPLLPSWAQAVRGLAGYPQALVALGAAVLLPGGWFALYEYRGPRMAHLRSEELLQRGAAAVLVGVALAAAFDPGLLSAPAAVAAALCFAVAVAPFAAAFSWDRRAPAGWQRGLVRALALALAATAVWCGAWPAVLAGSLAVARPMQQRLDVVFGCFCLAVALLALPWTELSVGLWQGDDVAPVRAGVAGGAR
jgi:hypothetical protein